MSNVIEIRQRADNEHRAGHYGIYIDGEDAEYTNDPSQHFAKCLAQAVKEGAEKPNERALELCAQRSVYCLERIVNHIKDGSLVPGGVPLGPDGLELDDIPGGKNMTSKPPRVSRQDAVTAFMTRGILKGLTQDERKARIKLKNEKRDHTAEWVERRKALVVLRQKELADLEKEAIDNPKLSHKLNRRILFLRREIRGLTVPVVAASHGYQYAYGQYITKQVSLTADDIRIVPCMTNTTCDTERDAKDSVSDFTTLDEFDGSGYSTGGQALDNQAVNIDDANDRAEFDADDEAATLGAGTRSIQGNLLISFLATLNASLPLHWLEYASNKTPDGSLFTVVFNARRHPTSC
jgi:hypothetical protein